MNLAEMLSSLSKGKRIRFSTWKNSNFIYLQENEILDQDNCVINNLYLDYNAQYEQYREFSINEFNLGFRFNYVDSVKVNLIVKYENTEAIICRDIESCNYIVLLKKDFPHWVKFVRPVP